MRGAAAARKAPRDGFGHELPNGGLSNDWLTPAHVLAALGPFDLDPCASESAPTRCAAAFYTWRENGLVQPWQGLVWCNPPYSNNVGAWIGRIIEHARTGGGALLLVFARTETPPMSRIRARRARDRGRHARRRVDAQRRARPRGRVAALDGLTFGSVCSGIEGASVAWDALGWTPAFFSETAAFPRALLEHHFPHVPCHGDFRTIESETYGTVDLLVGGTPCQDFSVAGLRAGMGGERGQLTIEYLKLLERLRPRWMVWENVPGVLSSDKGRAFGLFLGALGELGYGFAYRVLDAQYFGVPQRRRRVFVVGYFGDYRRAAAVLFERASLRGDTPPSRKAGARASVLAGDGAGSGVAQSLTVGLASGGPDAAHAQAGWLVASTLQAREGRHGARADSTLIAHTLSSDGFDASEDGTGRGTPLVFDTTQITSAENRCNPQSGDPCHPLAARAHAPAIAYAFGSHAGAAYGAAVNASHKSGGPVGANISEECAYTVRTERPPAIAVGIQSSQSGVREVDAHATLDANNGSRRHNGIVLGSTSRRRR